MQRWWSGSPDEKYWLETTDRRDLGVDLKAPKTRDDGSEFWSYSLVREVSDGDIVFHYHLHQGAIVAWSRAVGGPWEEDIVWAAHGTVAREAGIAPYRRPGIRMGLVDFALLPEPLTLSTIREHVDAVRAMRDGLSAAYGTPLYFPFEISEKRPPRPMQGYLAKLPEEFVAFFEPLSAAALRAERSTTVTLDVTRSHSVAPTPPSPAVDAAPVTRVLGDVYRRADELAATSERDPFAIDPSIVERGLRGHASTQNSLADFCASHGWQPRSPRPEEPNFDLAWSAGDSVFVAEVKSTVRSNEERQLRLGLGQVLRYSDLLSRVHRQVNAVLAVEREPSDTSWVDLCAAVGVTLTWPGAFDRLTR